MSYKPLKINTLEDGDPSGVRTRVTAVKGRGKHIKEDAKSPYSGRTWQYVLRSPVIDGLNRARLMLYRAQDRAQVRA